MNWREPGAKEFLVVGGVTLAAFFLWRAWKNRAGGQAAAPPSAAPAVGPSTPTGLSTATIVNWTHNWQSSPHKHHKKKS